VVLVADVAEVGEVVATMVEAGLAVSEAAAPEAAELAEIIKAKLRQQNVSDLR
jgi:hypothetical protein